MTTNFVPAQLPIDFQMEYLPQSQSSNAPDCWIYFTSNLPNQADATYELHVTGVSTPINSQTLTFGDVFRLGNIGHIPLRFSLTCTWTNCMPSGPGPYNDIEITAHYGSSCNSNDYIWNLPAVFNAGCVELQAAPFIIHPLSSTISVVLDNTIGTPSSVGECENFPVSFIVESTGADVKDAHFILTVPDASLPNLANAAVNFNGNLQTYAISTLPIITGSSIKTYDWDLLSLIQNVLSNQPPIHFNVNSSPFKIELNFIFQVAGTLPAPGNKIDIVYEAQGLSSCNSSVGESKSFTIDYTGGPTPSYPITQTGSLCNGSTVTLTAPAIVSGITYSWSNGASNVNSTTVNSAGLYTLTVISNLIAPACTTISNIIVEDNSPIVDILPNPLNYCVFQSSVLNISNSMDNNYSYVWSYLNTTSTGSTLNFQTTTIPQPNGSNQLLVPVSVTVTSGGCSVVENFDIEILNPRVEITTNDPLNFCGGSIQIEAINIFPANSTLVWSPNFATSTSIVTYPLSTQNYFVTAFNQQCPSQSNTLTFTNNAPIPLISSSSPYGYCNPDDVTLGVNLSAQGSQSPITTYSWNTAPVQTTPSIDVTPSSSTNYVVIITNNEGCTQSATITVDNITPTVLLSPSIAQSYCPNINQTNGVFLTAIPSPNNWIYSYDWNGVNGLNNYFAQPLTGSVTYTVTITNSQVPGCTAQASVVVSNSQPAIFVTPTIFCAPLSPQTITVNSTGGTLPYTYLWSTGALVDNIGITQSGTYTVTVTDASGCSNIVAQNIVDITPVVNLQTPIILPCVDYVDLLATSTTAGCTYTWAPPINTNGPSATTLPNSNMVNPYSVTVTSPAGCTVIANTTVEISDPTNCCDLTNELKLSDFSGTNIINTSAGSTQNEYNLNIDIVIKSTDDITIDGSTISIARGKSITIEDGGKLTIENKAHLKSCGSEMWHGIIVEPGGELIITGNNLVDQTKIEDADYAIDATMSASIYYTSVTVGEWVTFNNNKVGIYLHDGDFEHFFNISRTTFTCSKNLKIYPSNIHLDKSVSHIWAVDAGSVNIGNQCVFDDASIGIDVLRTNLNIPVECSFDKGSNPYFKTTGIRASGNKPSGATTYGNYSIIIGDYDPANSKIIDDLNGVVNAKNKFYNYDTQIEVYHNYDTKIIHNYFKHTEYPIPPDLPTVDVKVWNVNQQPVVISENFMDGFGAYAVELANDLLRPISIDSNLINPDFSTGGFDEAIESRVGIYVHNFQPSMSSFYSESLNIRDNMIANCKFGIHVLNQVEGQIRNNIINYFVPNNKISYSTGRLSARRGIFLQSTTSIDVENNSILRTINNTDIFQTVPSMVGGIQGDLAVGISNYDSHNLISHNIISNMPTSIVVGGHCLGSVFQCNELIDGQEGFKLRGANFQMDDQITGASGNLPNHNSWKSYLSGGTWPGNSRIIDDGLIPPSLVKWYYPNPNTDEDPTAAPFISSVIADVPSTFGFTDCVTPGCINCWPDRLYNIISDSILNAHSDEIAYYNRMYVYRSLKDSLQLMYSGSTYDVELQNFFTLMALNNIGTITEINELLSDDDRANAYLQNQNINPDYLMDVNTVKVNEICAGIVNDTLEYNEQQRSDLLAIAYQLPAFGGEAVYRARAILGIYLDDTEIAFRLASTENNSESNFIVEPNPTSGQFKIHYLLSKNESAKWLIYNTLGKLINQGELDQDSNFRIFDLSSNSSGIYSLIVETSTSKKMRWKISLIK